VRYLIISDIHSNLEALTAVLADAMERDVDEVVCLGDFVGYGANPTECVETFMALPSIRGVLGNHDAAVIDPGQRELFNPVARAGVLFSETNLSQSGREYLRALPMKIEVESEFLAVHSSPFRPEAWIYVVEPLEAADAFHVMRPTLAFIGHTHFPAIHSDNGSVLPLVPEDRIKVNANKKIMVNVGSVGQPRDGDPRAAYVMYDSDSKAIRIHRVEYDIDQAAAKILGAGLPPMLIQVGNDEILLSDSTRFADHLREEGVEVELEVFPDLWHVFQLFVGKMPESKAAILKIGDFIRRKLGEPRA